MDLPPSDALSIVKRPHPGLKGRKLGVLLTDGASAAVFAALSEAAAAEGAVVEVVAPQIAGVVLDDGTPVAAHQKIDGGPSVLYDAVAVLISAEWAQVLTLDKPSKDFVSDAFAHCKFIGFNAFALPLLEKAGVAAEDIDAGVLPLDDPADVAGFVQACRPLRLWTREPLTDLDAQVVAARP